MKVSVLVPAYNGGRHLAECLDSILAQDFRDFELLIADDNSTDQSPEIIKAFAGKDSRIRWWKNSRNFGLTGNSNVCLKEARGEYIKFVHQDDTLLSPSAISKMVATLDAHPGASLVGSRQHLTGTDKKPSIFPNPSGCYDGRRVVVNCFERNTNLVGQPTLTLFRREVGKRGFDERFTGHMDYEMWCHLLELGDFAYIDEPLATWRVHLHHQTARAESEISHEEYLRFIEIYYAKPWLRELATDRMLFAQIYYLQKHYGAKALPLTSVMRSQLSNPRYAWQWMKHKVSRPFQKLSQKL